MQDQIIDALRRGERATGLRMAQAFAETSPDDPQAHRLLSLAQSMNGESAAAHASLDRALSLAPHDAGLHYQRAVLFLGERRTDEAREQLGRTTEVDPNELRAYVMQAQLAIAQADLDEAERLARLAARIDAGHPSLLVTQGLVALHRGRLDEAHGLISRAAQLAPEDLQTRYALGLSFMAKEHWAFAEQAFRGVLERNPRNHSIRFMLADVMRRQQRYAEAAQALEAGAVTDPNFPPDLLRFAGELYLVAGEHPRALPLLRRAAAADPENRAALDALIEALRRQGDAADARHTLEAAIAAAPHIEGLWSARLSFEPADGDVAAIAERWRQAVPHSVSPLHVQMWKAARDGDQARALELAYRIVELEPGHYEAQTVIIDQLYLSDPAAAVAHIESLLPNVRDPMILRRVLAWLARAQDRAGRPADAAESWRRLDAIPDPEAVPLPERSGDRGDEVPSAAPSADAPQPWFVYGPPGSGVERVMAVLERNLGARVCRDRVSRTPPADPLQHPGTALKLADGGLDPAAVADAWRAALALRTSHVDDPLDWLPWWDNALLRVLRGALPGAKLLLVLADPRDMLLDWLQRGTYVRYGIESHTAIAAWLAGVLQQLAGLMEGGFVAHGIVRIDAVADDAQALAAAVGDAFGQQMEPAEIVGPGRYPPGHWRHYAQALAGPFALLTPVAMRLGYPET
jgi:tetratricopeptide (TPR) repeat protein